MIENIVILSLIITSIYLVFSQGMMLGFVRIFCANKLDKWFGVKASRYIQKPLWDCLPCMASVWTIILTRDFNIWAIMAVCGLNFLIEKTFLEDETAAGE